MKKIRKRRKKYRPALQIYKWCEICGAMFIPRRRHARFDTTRCKQVAYRQRIEERTQRRRNRRKKIVA